MPYIEIGSCPAEEQCAAIGQRDDAFELNQLECRAYIVGLKLKYGIEPEGARLHLRTAQHDFGSYAEVVCDYVDDNEGSFNYAMRLEAGLATWLQVGMWPPVTYDEKGVPVLILKNPQLWLRANNPDCRSEMPPDAPAT